RSHPAQPLQDERWTDRRTTTRDTPRDPTTLRRRLLVWNSRRSSHLGRRASRPRPTGRTYGRKRADPPLSTALQSGAVHIWVPRIASSGDRRMTMNFAALMRQLDRV